MIASRAAALALLLCGCGPTLPYYTFEVPPRTVDARPPRSVLFVGSALELAPLRAAIDRVTPPALDGNASTRLGPLGELAATWHLKRRPIALSAASGAIEIRVAAVGEVALSRGTFRCASGDAGLELVARARPRLDESGNLALVDAKVEAHPLGALDCGGLPVSLDLVLAPLLDLAARGLGAALGTTTIPLGPLVRQALAEIATPRAITVGGAAACLDLAPRALVLAPLAGDGDRLALRAGADVAPRVSLGRCPPATPPHWDDVVVREEPLAPRFRVAVATVIGADELQQRLSAALVGHRIGDGGDLLIEHVTVGDANGRILLRLDVSGAVRGALYLWGTPEVSERAGRFLLDAPDLQAALETRTFVDRLKVAIWGARGGDLVGAARRAIAVDVTDRLRDARAALSGRFVRDGGEWVRRDAGPGPALVVRLDQIVPGAVTSRPGALLASAMIEGQATVELP